MCMKYLWHAGNLLVDDAWQVKVADFGLARALEAAGSLTGGLGTYQVLARQCQAMCCTRCSCICAMQGGWV